MTMLKNKFLSTVAGAGLAVSGALGMANSAFADDSNLAGRPAVSASMPSEAQPMSVPVRNVRGTSDAFLRLLAADVSQDALVILFFGNDRELYNQVQAAALESTRDGYPVKGILVADGETGIEIYADSQSYTQRGGNDIDAVFIQTKGVIRDAYKNIILPNRQEQMVADTTPSVALAQD